MARTQRRRNRSNKSNRRTQKNQKNQKNQQKGGSKKGGSKKGGKRVNKYFQLMMNAKKNNLESFQYNGKTYKRQQKGHLTFYKA
jgi:hypothetical protein